MADQVDQMSDAELRTKLAEHGFPIMPVTASTRKLLVKKLKMVLDTKTKPRNSADSKVENRRSLARYSSGEESDFDTTASKDKRNRRATTGGAMLPPVTTKTRRVPVKRDSPFKRDDKGSESEEEKSPVRTQEEVETVTTRRVTRTYANDQDDYETGSDSDVDSNTKTSSPFRSNSRSSDYNISSTLPANDAPATPPRTSLFSRPSISTTNYSSLNSSDHLNSIRSRLGLTSSLGDRPSGSSYTSSFTSNTYQPTTSVDEVESPYLSNFTRRLSALKADPKPSTFLDRDNSNGNTVLPRRSYVSGISRSDVVDYKASNDKNFLKNNLVSLALVALVALFFFFLFFIYIVKKNEITSVVDDQNSVIPLCQINIPGLNRVGINCVPRDQVGSAKDLLKAIYPELTSRVHSYKCGEPDTVPYMTEKEIIDLASLKTDHGDRTQCKTDLNNLQVLLVHNPRWGISVVQLKNLYTNELDYAPITSTDTIRDLRGKGSIAVSLSDHSTPIYCLFRNTLYSAGSTIIIIAVLTVVLLGLQRFYQYSVNYQKKKNEEIYSMVEQIIDVISQETEESGEPYISVDHVRDTLISPQNREKMASTWDAAVKFIQKNESRVRMEVQSVDGEDCRVWRWIASRNSPKRSTSWQGQAFETQEGSVNNLTISPTPCLKIRHMFDKNDTNVNLRNVIQDVILEKCDQCNILHIDIEKVSCCVYVKCASPADAGIVYKSLHGWWYEGRLITVKYLRLERYMQRFPFSPSSGPYLKPRQRSA